MSATPRPRGASVSFSPPFSLLLSPSFTLTERCAPTVLALYRMSNPRSVTVTVTLRTARERSARVRAASTPPPRRRRCMCAITMCVRFAVDASTVKRLARMNEARMTPSRKLRITIRIYYRRRSLSKTFNFEIKKLSSWMMNKREKIRFK